jgi:GDP-4-dehydro-6-deoxy-D-mannose reductase
LTGHPLITGATGFAGGHLLDALRRDEACVHGWFNPGGRTPDRADATLEWTPVDLLDPAAVHRSLATIRPSAIYHCAGLADVHASWKTPTRALRINVLGTHNLLRAAKEIGLSCPILVIGSALVYQPSSEPLNEAHPLNPTSPYGISKLAQEMLGRASPLRILLARPFNHAGPRQDAHYATSAFARQLVEIEDGRREPVLRVGNLESRRDITDVRDTVLAYRALVARGTPHRPYNVCSGRAYRIGDLLDILLGLTRVRVRVDTDPDRLRPSDVPVMVGDPSRVADETGWRAQLPIERTLEDLLHYWRSALTRADPRPA